MTFLQRLVAAGHAVENPELAHPITTGGRYTTREGQMTADVTWNNGKATVHPAFSDLARQAMEVASRTVYGEPGYRNEALWDNAVYAALGLPPDPVKGAITEDDPPPVDAWYDGTVGRVCLRQPTAGCSTIHWVVCGTREGNALVARLRAAGTYEAAKAIYDAE